MNCCPEKISPTLILTPVSLLAPSPALIVWPAPTPHTPPAISQVSVFILTSNVTAILNVNQAKMRNCQCAKINS